MNLMRAVLAATILVLGTGAGLAQLLPSQQGAEKDAATGGGTTRTVSPGQSASGCFNVAVEVVDPHPSGLNWDIGSGRTSAPDPQITEATTGAQTSCRNTHTCTLRVENAGRTLSFNIMDLDLSAHDLIGDGQCAAGKTCRIGRARVSMSSC